MDDLGCWEGFFCGVIFLLIVMFVMVYILLVIYWRVGVRFFFFCFVIYFYLLFRVVFFFCNVGGVGSGVVVLVLWGW